LGVAGEARRVGVVAVVTAALGRGVAVAVRVDAAHRIDAARVLLVAHHGGRAGRRAAHAAAVLAALRAVAEDSVVAGAGAAASAPVLTRARVNAGDRPTTRRDQKSAHPRDALEPHIHHQRPFL